MQRPAYTHRDIVDRFGVTDPTTGERLDGRRRQGLLVPPPGDARIRRWAVGAAPQHLVEDALRVGWRQCEGGK